MANIQNLNKLFVRVPGSSSVTLESIVTTSISNQKKIYFVEKENTIVNNGVKYGIDPSTAEKIEHLIQLVGAEVKSADASTILERIISLEGIHTGMNDYIVITDSSEGATVNPSIGVNIVPIDTATSDTHGLVDAANAKAYIDAQVASANNKVAVTTGLSIAETAETDNSSTYTISPDIKLVYTAAANGQTSKIELKSNDDTSTFGSIDVSTIIGDGLIKGSAYNPSTGILTLTFNHAGGTDSTYDINLHEMLDINDMSVKNDSSKYLSVTLDGTGAEDGKSQAIFETLMQDVSTATESATGLADAWKVKQYVDSKSSDLAVTAEGDDYVSATVDATTDNKHVVVETNVDELTATAGTPGTYEADGTQTTAPSHGSLSGTANSLGDAADIATKVKTYVDGEVAIETARTDAEIKKAIAALDSEDSGKGTNVSVDVSIVDGKLADVSVVEDYATITRTAHANGDPVTHANYVVTEGDENKLVKASNLADLKAYTDDKIAESAADLHVSVTGDNYINAAVAANDNKHIDVSADVQALTATAGTPGVYDAEGNETTAPVAGTLSGVADSLVDGADVATKVKTYVDGAVAIEAARTDAEIDKAIAGLDSSLNSTGSVNVAVDASIEDGKLVKLNVTEAYATVSGTRWNPSTPVDASFVVTEGTKMVTGDDLVTLREYVDDVVAANTTGLQVNGETSDPTYISLTQKTGDNKTLVVDVSVADLTFTQGTAGADSTLTGTDGQFADSGDVADKVEDFVNARLTEEVAKLDSSVEKSDTAQYVTVTTEIADGKLADASCGVDVQYGSFTNDSSLGIAKTQDVQAFVDTYDFWEDYRA